MRRFGTGEATDRFGLRCVGRACDGAEIAIVLARPVPVQFTVVGTRSGLPSVAAPLVATRGPTARPQYATDSTITLSRLSYHGQERPE